MLLLLPFISEETETEKLSSLPSSYSLYVWKPGVGPRIAQPLCFTFKCQWLGCLGLQFPVTFPIIAFSLPFGTEPWSGLGHNLGFWFGFLPQLYGRHKEYLSSLVGTDFEMVSTWLPAALWAGLRLWRSHRASLKGPQDKLFSSVSKEIKK